MDLLHGQRCYAVSSWHASMHSESRIDGVGNAGPGNAASKKNVCVMVHGMGGDFNDWDVWKEFLKERFSTWSLKPLKSLSDSTKFLAKGLDEIAALAADEIVTILRNEQEQLDSPKNMKRLILHFVCHSMGGLIIRGALPRIFEVLSTEEPNLGHYISLSTPHLGIQATWKAPYNWWKNLAPVTSLKSSQVVQLTIQDGGNDMAPYLVQLSDPDGPYLKYLAQFQRRSCITMSFNDPLIPMNSGIIQSSWTFEQNSVFDAACWQFDQRCGTNPNGPFEKFWEASPRNLAKSPPTPDYQAPTPEAKPQQQEKSFPWRKSLTSLLSFGTLGGEETNEQEQEELSWSASADGMFQFPDKVLSGLSTLQWQRLAVRMHSPPETFSRHVFLIAKKSEQAAAIHDMSRECVRCLVEILAD